VAAADKAESLGNWTVGLYGVPSLPRVVEGDDIGTLVCAATRKAAFAFRDGDIVVVAHKIVSKAERAIVRLAEVEPSQKARELAEKTGRDPRACEVYLRESEAILGTSGRMVITRHRLGFEDTNAGVDMSNGPGGEEIAVLLPTDPDASARRIRDRIRELAGVDVAVIISDSAGRADRHGSIGEAIGLAGIRHLEVRRQTDLNNRSMIASLALVDELASAAFLIMGECDEGLPVVVIRGVRYTRDDDAAIHSLLFREAD